MSDVRMSRGVVRRSFDKIKEIVPVPNLIEIQSSSFNDFVQLDCLPEEREHKGLEKVFRDVFPIDYEDKLSLEYVSYELGNWECACGKLTGIVNRYQWSCSSCKASGCSRLSQDSSCPECSKKTARYVKCVSCLSRVVIRPSMTLDECRASGQTYSLPLRVKMQLIGWTIDETGGKVIRDIKEQTIFFVDLPVMVDLYEETGRFKLGNLGTFLINGVDRVIVSQLHRSPGVVISQSKKIRDYRGRPYYLARIIPTRGSWIDFEFDSNDILYVRIDKKKKLLATTFLQALGYERDHILPLFYQFDTILVEKGELYREVDSSLLGQRIEKGMVPEKLESLFAGKRVTNDILELLQKHGIEKLLLKKEQLLSRIVGKDVIDEKTGEVLLEHGTTVSEEFLDTCNKFKSIKLSLVQPSGYIFQPTIAITLGRDRCFSQEDALRELHTKVWPGDSAVIKDIQDRLTNLFFNPRLYDLTRVGRVRMNKKLNLPIADDVTVLTKEDIIAAIQYLVALRERGEGELDDIDHLGNRRVRLVGELLNNQMYLGFTRIERIVRDRFRMQEAHGALMPQDLLNVKPLSAVLREFFGLGQLSQFMDQTNPLSEIAHKRRLSALGPGGVLKDRATFEIRDVHTSHYGRICPIETPEGQTVGLISSLSTYAMVNDLGFIETAYRPVSGGKVLDDVVFLDAFDEEVQYIAQASAVDPVKKKLAKDRIFVRHEGNYQYVEPTKVSYIDLSPKQLVSVSAALIPFLEHDDAVRALMGANMQRQAVPLIRQDIPIVGTGMECEIVKASGAVITAKRSGIVEYADAEKIIIRADEREFYHQEDWVSQAIDVYHLRKFERSSYSTWIHHTSIVKSGDRVKAGDVLTNGPAIASGELALGSNLLVGFMPWNGYNFEDAIVISDRLVSEDVMTSVHIDEYVVEARETKLGPEEITRDIPNVSENLLESLDEDGIVRIGTRVKAGDILVGKVTLKGDVQYSPEEKLLRAIFGEKSREVRDTSLRVPPGGEGVVADIKIFSRSGVRKDKRYKEEVARFAAKLEHEHAHYVTIFEKMIREKLISLLHEADVSAKEIAVKDATLDQLFSLKIKNKSIAEKVKELRGSYETQLRILQNAKEDRASRLKRGDVLPSGVIKVVKIYVAMKRPISVGDKMAGRHGNKGVVSIIVPREDMPCLDDGTPLDIVLNPLGIVSRMNVGQILETLMGLAGKSFGERIAQFIDQGRLDQAKKLLTSAYGSELIENYEKEFGTQAVVELAYRASKQGVCFRTPVFDGAEYEHDIKPMLEELQLPVNGSVRLRDGRSGEYFEQPVTIGFIYMMKLNHMVDDKLHARSVGPYSLVTQQPLGGKALQGGQRLGEMEVWALEAYGAAYTLQEMLTYKSDDVTGRHKAYNAIVRGEEVPEPGVPESFNVLIKELQSLALQVDLLKVSKENVSE